MTVDSKDFLPPVKAEGSTVLGSQGSVLRAQVFGKEAPSVTVDSKDFLPPAPKGSGDEEHMGRRV